MHLKRSPSHGHALCFQQLTNQKNPHCVSFRNVHLAAAPPEPALRDIRFGEHLGEVLSLASFRTKPMQAVRHWSVGVSEAQRLAGHWEADTAVEKLRYTWQTCLVNVNCLTWQITPRDGQHRDLYNTPLANTPHTLLCTTYKESDPLAFYFLFWQIKSICRVTEPGCPFTHISTMKSPV